MAAFRSTLLALAALLVFVLPMVVAEGKWWIAIEHVSKDEVQSLITDFDVRGHFESLVFVVAPEAEAATLRQRFPRTRALQPVNDKHLVVFERQSMLYDSVDAHKTWITKTTRALTQAGHTILMTTNRRLVAAVHGDYGQLERLDLPASVEFLPLSTSPFRPRPEWQRERMAAIRRSFNERADIREVLVQVNETSLRAFAEYLTGESGSNLNSRNSYSEDVKQAANYLQERLTGYGFSVTQEIFRSDMGPNVIAVRRGAIEPDVYVVLGAHYDSRASMSSSPTQRAPGGNDDGSGTSALLEIARIISDQRLSFRYSVILGFWCGEEQGLVGSRAYARKIADEGVNVLAMFQGDMLAFRATNEAPQCAFPTRYDDPDLTTVAIDVVETYVPELTVCFTSACCSDHQSFTENGYSATQIFERCGGIADNQYHATGDLVNRQGYDLQQLTYNARAFLSNLCVFGDLQ